MWLRSQNTKLLINASAFSVEERKILVRIDGAAGGSSIVGIYETPERAMEVLEDIQYEIMHYTIKDNVYRMPEK